ncbi:MAG: endonuclease/exonuclease/phosphatase family protein, partial [Anaerolineae bacterium]
VPVWAMQGPGFKSPYANSSLQTEGIVTALFNPAQIPGFFIQEAATDADPATSAGLFVWAEAGAEGVAPGDVVRVAGVVREVSGQTQLKLERVEVLAHGAPLPEAAPLDPPPSLEEANVYYEALEGMLVRVDGVAVSPISKYGETNLVLPKHQRERIFRGEGQPAGLLITVDDNSWTARYDDAANLPFSVVSGDLVAGVAGPLAYTFGQYKIEPLAPPTVIPGQFERVPSLPEVSAAGFSLAMYNVENFFDDKDPNPADPPRPNRRQYLRKAAKIANSIAAMGYPTLIAFAEVENIGVLERVAGQPQLADYNYRAVLVEGRDSRGIDVGYLVRGDRAEALNAELRLDDEGLFTRGPLVLQTRIATPNGDVTLYTLANHWVSLGAGFETTEPRREQQAQWNLNLAAEILAADPQARIAILGDLNTFLDAPSIQLLRNAGFVHVFDFLPPEERYTYIYQGESETLDHILVTPNLAELIAGVSVLHINADFPPAAPDDDSPRRTSDHDPVVVQFEMK